ncbi:ABC transporter substrate-binding protein [Leucobacter sp. M11]|uniref:ABC transporter substrate-binding protein n=1 Tax=Leucobacter sp. M11 TaxID=2993565 RepID=UPI002D7E2A5D|nr:ABC transporter substrate-binding protein [Leucobacter sp. M11]MEB4613801.1 ABC transporter substrate-binding protein [Leucobacter sp. M11]
MKTRTRFPLLAALAVGSLALTACAGGGTASDGGTEITVTSAAQPPNLDPHITQVAMVAELTRPVYETLVTVDENYEVQPMLAESFERSEDGLTYTFTLREGVTFHDGSELDATDVIASMERWTRLSPAGQTDFAGATWTSPDANTVVLTVKTPSFLHLLHLSSRLLNVPVIMPSEIIEAGGDEPINEVIGTGPYTFVEWVADQRLVLEKWDEYQSVDAPSSGLSGKKDAKIDSITYEFVTDPTTTVAGIQTGQYDATTGLGFDSVEQLEADPSVTLGTYQVEPINMAYNIHSGTVSDVNIRQAINIALDRDEIMTATVGKQEYYDLVHHNMTKPWEPLWNTEVGKDTFNTADTAKAKELLAQGGYTNQPITLLTTGDFDTAQDSAVMVQAQLQALGMNVEVESLEWAAFIERYLNDQDSWDLGLIPQVVKNEPTQTIGFVPGNPGYSDSDELHALLESYRSAPTIEDAQLLYNDMQQYVEDLRPLSRLGDAHSLFATSDRVKSFPIFDSTVIWWNAEMAE